MGFLNDYWRMMQESSIRGWLLMFITIVGGLTLLAAPWLRQIVLIYVGIFEIVLLFLFCIYYSRGSK